MTKEAQRIAIAEACGWKRQDGNRSWPKTYWVHSTEKVLRTVDEIPDYLNDLNAMHEAEKACGMSDLTPRDKSVYGSNGSRYRKFLQAIAGNIGAIHATASQRAEAFLRTIGKWEDDK